MNNGRKKIRVLHTSDIHLGASDFRGYVAAKNGELDDPARHTLKVLVDFSAQAETDLVIIAGDLFDHNRVDTATLEFALKELRRVIAPVLILPGNHDCLVTDSVYRRIWFSEFAPNVRVFTAPEGERFSFPELDLAVWGKAITNYGGDLRPMAGIPPRGGERWQIAVAHGWYVGAELRPPWSLPIGEEEIVKSCQDYVAPGHGPSFRCVCSAPVKAFYSGSASEAGTVAVVDFLDEEEVQVHCHSIAPQCIMFSEA